MSTSPKATAESLKEKAKACADGLFSRDDRLEWSGCVHAYLAGAKEAEAQVEDLKKERDGFSNGQLQCQHLLNLALDDKLAITQEAKTLKAKLQEAERALETTSIRLEILKNRMHGCHVVTGNHELLAEAEAFVEEAKEALKKIRGET